MYPLIKSVSKIPLNYQIIKEKEGEKEREETEKREYFARSLKKIRLVHAILIRLQAHAKICPGLTQ